MDTRDRFEYFAVGMIAGAILIVFLFTVHEALNRKEDVQRLHSSSGEKSDLIIMKDHAPE